MEACRADNPSSIITQYKNKRRVLADPLWLSLSSSFTQLLSAAIYLPLAIGRLSSLINTQRTHPYGTVVKKESLLLYLIYKRGWVMLVSACPCLEVPTIFHWAQSKVGFILTIAIYEFSCSDTLCCLTAYLYTMHHWWCVGNVRRKSEWFRRQSTDLS